MADGLKKLETELKIRGFSKQTIKAYGEHNRRFLEFIGKDPVVVEEDDIKLYLANLISDKKLASSSVALTRSALLFFYNEVLGKGFNAIKTPKIVRKAPAVLTKDEIRRLLEAASNEKSRLLIEFLFSSGLRVSECLALKYEDLDFEQGLCTVRQGKGNKDRVTILSKSLMAHLKPCGERVSFSGLVFPNALGRPLSVRNAQKIVSSCAARAGIKKKVTPHKLRHSFATHLLDAGVSIRVIQELLGHSNLQTTQIYTQVSKEHIKTVKSPLDDL